VNLLAAVGLVHETIVSDTTGNFLLQLLRKVHSVCDGNHEQARVSVARPVEEVIEKSLFLCYKGVKLIDQYYTELLGLALKTVAMGSTKAFGGISLIQNFQFVLLFEEFIKESSRGRGV